MTDHTDLGHAKMIAHLMPERELRVGDRVWQEASGLYATIVRFKGISVKLVYDAEPTFYDALITSLIRLYTFSEIWAELPEGTHAYKRGGYTEVWTPAKGDIIMSHNPANAAAELLAWVRSR